MAEFVWGSEAEFVNKMNERAAGLGMTNTHFENTNGLDDTVTAHLTSAKDIAIMSRELIKHEKILEYSATWMDTIRDGAFGLANTNKLVRFYKGANGMKTGFTSEAGYCLSGTALRDGMQLIAVVLGSPTSEDRFALAKQLLDFGFASYRIVTPQIDLPHSLPVTCGVTEQVKLSAAPPALLLGKGASGALTQTLSLPDFVEAPVKKGQQLGTVEFAQNGVSLGVIPVLAAEDAKRMDFLTMLNRILTNIFSFL